MSKSSQPLKNFSHVSERNENEINISQNGNYLISVRGLTEEDGEASGGSINISYETKDLRPIYTKNIEIISASRFCNFNC